MSEPREHKRCRDAIIWMNVLRDLTDQASLPDELEERIATLIVEIARESPSKFLRDFYYSEIRNALRCFLEKPSPRWLVTNLDILRTELKTPEDTYHGLPYSDTPFYPGLFRPHVTPTAYVPQTQPSVHTPTQPVSTQSTPKAAWSSLRPDPSSIRNKEHDTSHADSRDYYTKNIMEKVQKKETPLTEAPSYPKADGSRVTVSSRPSSTLRDTGLQSVKLTSATSTVGYKTKAQHAEASLSRDNPFQHIVRSNKVQKPAAQTPDNMVRPQPVSNFKDAASQVQPSGSGKAAIPARTDAGISRQMHVPKIPQGAVSENGVTRQKDRNEEAQQLPGHRQKPSENLVDVDKQPQDVHKASEAAAKESEKPTSGPTTIIRPLNSVPAKDWKISWPIFVAIDIGAWKEDHSQISSVGLNALDVAKKPERNRSSKEWMDTSLRDTMYLRIAEALEGPHPAAYIPSRYCDDEVVRRADVKDKFKSYMQRFPGRNVIFTFHGAGNDLRWMEELGMVPFSNYDFNPAGWLDTAILIRRFRPSGERNLEAAMEWIGHDMQPNEWHNSASDAVNINRLVARLVFNLRASPR